nr:MAG TPA: hypothetical protein [Caudoviricetes sp.]
MVSIIEATMGTMVIVLEIPSQVLPSNISKI